MVIRVSSQLGSCQFDSKHLFYVIDFLLSRCNLFFLEALQFLLLDLAFINGFSAEWACWSLVVGLVVVDPLLNTFDMEEVFFVAVQHRNLDGRDERLHASTALSVLFDAHRLHDGLTEAHPCHLQAAFSVGADQVIMISRILALLPNHLHIGHELLLAPEFIEVAVVSWVVTLLKVHCLENVALIVHANDPVSPRVIVIG